MQKSAKKQTAENARRWVSQKYFY